MVHVDATTIDLAGQDLVVEFEPEWDSNALVEVDPDGDGARILTGQEIGTIHVTMQLWDDTPPLPEDLDTWQDAAGVSQPSVLRGLPLSWAAPVLRAEGLPRPAATGHLSPA
jgi:hypothetical protein